MGVCALHDDMWATSQLSGDFPTQWAVAMRYLWSHEQRAEVFPLSSLFTVQSTVQLFKTLCTAKAVIMQQCLSCPCPLIFFFSHVNTWAARNSRCVNCASILHREGWEVSQPGWCCKSSFAPCVVNMEKLPYISRSSNPSVLLNTTHAIHANATFPPIYW